jgi:hypothetical protein
MMALFIVLWLMNTNQKVQQRNRRLLSRSLGQDRADTGNGDAGSGENLAVNKQDMEKLKAEDSRRLSREHPDFQKALKDKVQMTAYARGFAYRVSRNRGGSVLSLGQRRFPQRLAAICSTRSPNR